MNQGTKIIQLRLPILVRLSNLYWGWWDLINTSIVIIIVAAFMVYISLHLMGALPAFSIFNLSSSDKDPQYGAGLLGFTASAGSAAGLWILSRCIERWSVINRVIGINNEFLGELGSLSIANAQEWKAALKAYTWAISLLDTKILLLNAHAQKHLYGSLICSNILIEKIEKSDAIVLDGIKSEHFNRFAMLYVKLCLTNLNLNAIPLYMDRMFLDSLTHLDSVKAELSKQILADLDLFAKAPPCAVNVSHAAGDRRVGFK